MKDRPTAGCNCNKQPLPRAPAQPQPAQQAAPRPGVLTPQQVAAIKGR